MVLCLLNRLVDSLFPPAGGTEAEMDAKFDDLVARYYAVAPRDVTARLAATHPYAPGS